MNQLQWYRDLLTPVTDLPDVTGHRALLIKEQRQVAPALILEEGEIPLGFKTTSYTPANLVILKLDIHSPLFCLVTGKPRTGKGVAGAYLAEQLFYKAGAKILSFDSARELFTHKLPFAFDEPMFMQQRWDAFFNQFSLQRRGFDMFQLAPKFLGDVMNVDKKFAFSYNDVKQFNKYNPSEAKTTITELIAGDSGSAGQVLISRALNDLSITSWQGFYNKLLSLRKGENKDDPLRSKVTAIFQGLADCIENGYVSDNSDDHIDLLEIVRDHEWVNFVGQLRGVQEDNNETARYNAIVKLYYQIILTDVRRFKDGDVSAYIRTPVTILAPELDSAVPRVGTSSLKQLFTSFVLKYGKWGVNSISDVQDTDKIEPSIAKNSAMLSSKAEGSNLDAFQGKGVTDYALEMMKSMATRQKTSVGTNASMFAYVGRRLPNRDEFGNVDTTPLFAFMFPTTSAFYQEGKNY